MLIKSAEIYVHLLSRKSLKGQAEKKSGERLAITEYGITLF